VGSGPFEIETFQQGSFMTLTPSDGHPVHNIDHSVQLQGFADQQSALQAFQNGELDMLSQLSPSATDTLEQNMDNVEFVEAPEFTSYHLYPQHPVAPSKFGAFRQAIGMAFNRQQIHDVTFRGAGEMDFTACVMSPTHPWRPPEEELTKFTDEAQGDPEGAKQVLRDAGWGWDDQGRLHYPADADLSPVYPEGEEPTSEQGFDCLDSEGKYVAPN